MTTRFVHVVRCKAKNSDGTLDDTKYADVQVIDQICITTDNGGQETFNFTAANAIPTIVDVAGDGGGIDNGNGATRQSRLLRVTNPNDSTMFFNEEVLDRVCITRNGGSQEIWDFGQINTFIEATTGPDFSAGDIVDSTADTLVNNQSAASRLIEVDEVLPGQTDAVPPQSDGTNYMAVADLQQVCVTINGNQSVFDFSDGNRDVTDTTRYTFDADGNPIPPDNADPNSYVVIPSDSGGLSTGNALVQQGLLWKIINFSLNVRHFIVGGNTFNGIQGEGFTEPAPVLLVKEDGSFSTLGIAELDAIGSPPFLDGRGGYAWNDSNIGEYQRFNSKGVLLFTEPGGSVLSLDNNGNLYSVGSGSGAINRVSPLGAPNGTVSGSAIGYTPGSIAAIGSVALFVAGLDNSGNNTLVQKLTFDGSPGWGPITLVGTTVGCATDGTDLWVATENLDQIGGNLTKLSGATGHQIVVVPQSPIPVGMDVDGSGNPVVLLFAGGNSYQYVIRSFTRAGVLTWNYVIAPPGPTATGGTIFGWLQAGARGVGGNTGAPSLAAGTKTIALAYGWQNGPFVSSGDISYALQTTQAYTGNTGFNQQGSMSDMEMALANIQPWIGTISINDMGFFPDFHDHVFSVTTTATAYPGGATSSENFIGMNSAMLWASSLPIWSSAEVVTTGTPTGAQSGIIEIFLTGLDAKTGNMKWQLVGSGALGLPPSNPNAQPLTGALPFVPVVNRSGR